MKLIKYVSVSLLIFFLSVLFIIVGFVLFFDLSKYKGDIEKLLSDQLNRKVEIAGDLDISLYPFFSLDIEKIKIYNPAFFEEPYFIKIDKINLSINMFELIKNKEILVKNISLIEPEINLVTLDNSTTNWTDLINIFKGNKTSEEIKIDTGKEKVTYSTNTRVLIDTIKVKNGKITIKDSKSKQLTYLEDLNLGLDNLGEGRDGKYDYSAFLRINKNRCNIEAKGSFKKDKEIIYLLNNNLKISNIKVNNKTIENVFLSFTGDINLIAGITQLDDININYKTLKTQLRDIHITSKTKDTIAEGYLYIEDKYKTKNFKIKTPFRYKNGVINLSDLSLVYGDLKSSGNASLSFADKIDVQYALKCDKINIYNLLKGQKREESDGNANNIQNIVNLTNSSEQLKAFKTDDFTLTGNITVNELILDNKTFDNFTLHTKLEKNNLINEAKFKFKKAEVTSLISFEKNKADEFVFTFHVFANTFNLHEIIKNKINRLDVLNSPSLKLVLALSKNSISLNELTFTAQLNNKYPADVNVRGSFNINSGNLHINASEIKFNKSNFSFSLNSNVKNILQNIYGATNGKINLDDLVYFIRPSEPVNVNEMINIKAKYNINISSKFLSIEDIHLAYKNTHFLGNISGNFKKSPILNILLSADYVNTDDIMGIYSLISAKNTNTKDISKVNTNENNIKEEEQAKSDEKINILLTIDKLIFGKLGLENIRLNGKGEENKYSFDVDANFYKGKFDGFLIIDTDSNSPVFDFKGNLKDVATDKLLVALVNKPIIAGVGNVDVQLKSSGINVDEIVKKLNGTVAVNITNGTLYGLNIGFILRNIFSLIEGRDFVINKASQDFTRFDASINVKDGVFYNNDLFIYSPIFTIRGDGMINVPKNNMDYKIYLSLLKPAFDNATEEENEKNNVVYSKLLNKEIPIRYYGPIYKPKQDIDYKGFIEKTFGRELIENIKPIKQRIDKFIKDLF
jgi:uncharacterized protein involved in outer membrane biogenesis